jgi:hypothetical protein
MSGVAPPDDVIGDVALTDVTPAAIVQDLSADKSYVTLLIVSVLLVGTYPVIAGRSAATKALNVGSPEEPLGLA